MAVAEQQQPTPIERAIQHFQSPTSPGAQRRLAEAISQFIGQPLNPARVSKWLNYDQQMPSEIAVAIQEVTAGAVKAEEFRPDLAEYFAKLHDIAAALGAPHFEVGQRAGQRGAPCSQ